MYTRVIIFSVKETEKVRVFIISLLKYQVSFHAKTYFHMLNRSSLLQLQRFAPFTGKKKTKRESEVVCFLFGVKHYYWIIEQTLHGRLEVWNFSSTRIENYIVYFTWSQTLKEKFVPTRYHVISFMYLGHEDIYSEKLTYIPLVTYHQSDKRQLYFAVLLL